MADFVSFGNVYRDDELGNFTLDLDRKFSDPANRKAVLEKFPDISIKNNIVLSDNNCMTLLGLLKAQPLLIEAQKKADAMTPEWQKAYKQAYDMIAYAAGSALGSVTFLKRDIREKEVADLLKRVEDDLKYFIEY